MQWGDNTFIPAMIKTLNINSRHYIVEVDSLDIPLAWVLREQVGLPLTTNCLRENCHGCQVCINGHAVRSCSTPLYRALNNQITTELPIPAEIPESDAPRPFM